jgi:hypothetical protein
MIWNETVWATWEGVEQTTNESVTTTASTALPPKRHFTRPTFTTLPRTLIGVPPVEGAWEGLTSRRDGMFITVIGKLLLSTEVFTSICKANSPTAPPATAHDMHVLSTVIAGNTTVPRRQCMSYEKSCPVIVTVVNPTLEIMRGVTSIIVGFLI